MQRENRDGFGEWGGGREELLIMAEGDELIRFVSDERVKCVLCVLCSVCVYLCVFVCESGPTQVSCCKGAINSHTSLRLRKCRFSF